MIKDRGIRPSPLTEQQLRKLVSEAINEAADYSNPETFHARFGHVERGLQIDDVIHGLELRWKFERSPVFNTDSWQWKYYIDTKSVDGKPMTIIIAVDTLDKSFEVITRWRQR
jgi:hypothetical protein